MEVKLADYGRVFATRERAREIIDSLTMSTQGESLFIDLSGVSSASPSFMAELLAKAMVVFISASIVDGNEHLRWLTASLVEKLGLVGRVRLTDAALT